VPKTTRVGTQANRPGCAADVGGRDRQGTSYTRRRGSLAHNPRRVHGYLRHHVTTVSICVHNEPLTIAATDVNNPDRSPSPLPSYQGLRGFFRVCFSPGYDLALAPRTSTIFEPSWAVQNESVPAIETSVGSRDHCTSRVCSGLMDRVAQGRNIRSPVALA
jgi:hypothetical protein